MSKVDQTASQWLMRNEEVEFPARGIAQSKYLMVIVMRSPPFICELARSPSFEEDCTAYLVHLRWPCGVTCIRCGGERVFSFSRKKQNGADRCLFECHHCRYQFSATTGTIFHKSHLSLTKWFLAIQRLSSADQRVGAKQLERELAVTYETAWNVTRRIRLALKEDGTFRSKFSGVDEIWNSSRDKTYPQLQA